MGIDINQLVIYRNILEDGIVKNYIQLINEKETSVLYYPLIHELLLKGEFLFDHILKAIIDTENTFTIQLEKSFNSSTQLNPMWLKNDLSLIKTLFETDIWEIAQKALDEQNMLSHLLYGPDPHSVIERFKEFFINLTSRSVTEEDCTEFTLLCRTYGIGKFAFHQAFYFTNQQTFHPIKDFNPLGWEQIYSYAYQKQQLYENTYAFVSGAPFHNALLVGSSGTGKSSSVKAIINLFAPQKLRLLQMHKGQLSHLPKVLEQISGRTFKFIIFIDDLSFEANEDEYKFLKSFIEGGIANEADNVAFYITSNRRHLIKEIRSERENDIHLHDFIQEMTSLSDRFGLTLFYEAPNQKVYLDMIEKMLGKQGEVLPPETLAVKARQWSLEHGGMSGRTAEQFVKHVLIEKINS